MNLNFIQETLSGITPISKPYGSEPVMPAGMQYYRNMVDIPIWTGLSDEKRLELLNGENILQEHKHMEHLFGAEYQVLFTNRPMDYQTSWLLDKTEEMLNSSYQRLQKMVDLHPTVELCPDCSLLKIKALLGHKLMWKLFHILCNDCYEHLQKKLSGQHDEMKKQDHDKKLDMANIEKVLHFTKKSDVWALGREYYERCKKLIQIAREYNAKNEQYFNFHDPLGELRLIVAGMDDLYSLDLAILDGCAIKEEE